MTDSSPDDLRLRYQQNLPRYTSYPTAPHFRPITPEDARSALAQAAEGLSIYSHVPFCTRMCWYCGCNKEIVRRPPAAELLDDLVAELEMLYASLGSGHTVHQLHLGGGTPTTLPVGILGKLLAAIAERSPFAPDAELAIEIDPRSVDDAYVDGLVALGFNRFSIGVQDFEPSVMEAVNRPQPRFLTDRIMARLAEHGDFSISFDLLYGLPNQTLETFGRTLDAVAELLPGRVALFPYAHLPHLRPSQKLLERVGLPTPDERTALFELAIARLGEAGYARIGMDHFARAGDPMHTAWEAGELHRNFQGYTTRPELDLVGIGPSAIGCYGGLYAQSDHTVDGWRAKVRAGELPVTRGWLLSADDRERARIIADLLCHGETRWGAYGRAQFAPEVERLGPLVADGLVELRDDGLALTDAGADFSRHVAAVFDAYLSPDATRYSSTV